MKDNYILNGVQAIMYYSANCGCEAEWFCHKCPFVNTFCDKEAEDQSVSARLSDEAEKYLKDNGVYDPWGWTAPNTDFNLTPTVKVKQML